MKYIKIVLILTLIIVSGIFVSLNKNNLFSSNNDKQKTDSICKLNELLNDSIKLLQLQSNQLEHIIYDNEILIDKLKQANKNIKIKYEKEYSDIDILSTDDQIKLLSTNLSTKDSIE